METEFKGLLHLSRAEYTTLSTTGTLTKGGQTFTFDPLGTEYVVPKEASGGGVTMDLLWENARPGGDFYSQTISVSLADYALVAIAFRADGNSNTDLQYAVISMRTSNINESSFTVAFDKYINDTGLTTFSRNLKLESNNNGIYFSGGSTWTAGASRTDSTKACVPVKIYGIKL